MMISEFIERTKYEPSFEEYHYIEESYYEFSGNKDEFCKWWKKARKSGEWEKELKLRKKLDEQKAEYEAKLADAEENIEFYRGWFNKALSAEKLVTIFKMIGKDKVSFAMCSKNDTSYWHSYKNVRIKLLTGAGFDFINIIEESGWITSVRIDDIEAIRENQ